MTDKLSFPWKWFHAINEDYHPQTPKAPSGACWIVLFAGGGIDMREWNLEYKWSGLMIIAYCDPRDLVPDELKEIYDIERN